MISNYQNNRAGGPKHTPSFRVGWPPAIWFIYLFIYLFLSLYFTFNL